jgi:hypothetical protein
MGLNGKWRAWSAAEDEKLTALCKGHSTSLSAGWEEIAQHFEGRSYLADFDEARELMKQDGWRVRKIAGEWLHGCNKCGAPT